MKTLLAAMALLCSATWAQAQSPNNVSRAWSAPSMPSTDLDRALRSGFALQDHLLNNGGNTNAGSGGTINNYNAPVTVNNNGPVANSGANVTNVQNLSEITATGGSTATATQSATGGTQSGAATSNATTQRQGIIGTNQSTTSN
jgi:hypothetical protein